MTYPLTFYSFYKTKTRYCFLHHSVGIPLDTTKKETIEEKVTRLPQPLRKTLKIEKLFNNKNCSVLYSISVEVKTEAPQLRLR